MLGIRFLSTARCTGDTSEYSKQLRFAAPVIHTLRTVYSIQATPWRYRLRLLGCPSRHFCAVPALDRHASRRLNADSSGRGRYYWRGCSGPPHKERPARNGAKRGGELDRSHVVPPDTLR
jgi:hypothetical protein